MEGTDDGWMDGWREQMIDGWTDIEVAMNVLNTKINTISVFQKIIMISKN